MEDPEDNQTLPWPEPAGPRLRGLRKARKSPPAVLMIFRDVPPVPALKSEAQLTVASAERLSGDALITFSDGRCALYSAELLSRLFSQAEEATTESSKD